MSDFDQVGNAFVAYYGTVRGHIREVQLGELAATKGLGQMLHYIAAGV